METIDYGMQWVVASMLVYQPIPPLGFQRRIQKQGLAFTITKAAYGQW